MSARVVKVHVEGDRDHRVPVGTPVSSLLGHRDAAGRAILGAIVNNRLVSLAAPIRGAARVRAVTERDRQGATIYRRSISMILAQAVWESVPDAELRIGQSLGDGYFFEFLGEVPCTEELVRQIEERMRTLVAEDWPLVEELLDLDSAIALFEAEGDDERVRLLRTLRVPVVPVIALGARHALLHGPVAPSTGDLGGFELAMYNGGLALRFPNPGERKTEIGDMPRLFQVYRDTRQWNEIIGVADVGQFNEVCLGGGVGEIVKVAEGLHERKVVQIADEICERGGVRVVLISGPSSSGKTTFTKRLSVQLRVDGLRPVALSLDDYYVDRADTPRDERGEPDFEAVEALDLPLLHQHLVRLLEGEEVLTPRYDFSLGKRARLEKWRTLRLRPDAVLLIEGLHALHDRPTEPIPAAHKFGCYVSALTQLTIDNHERIFTSDSRLLRRIVRDRLFRGYRAERTIEMWPAVRRGEQRHIFPFQEHADAIFNSALVYEPAVLKMYAERFLLEVPTTSPAFAEADRLFHFLSLFVPVFAEEVPHASILREFIGGSSFNY